MPDISIPLVTIAIAKPNKRLWQLFSKPDPLTEEEWAELALYEAMQKEEHDEAY